VVSFTSQLLYPQGRSPQYPPDRMLEGSRASLEVVMERKIPRLCHKSNPRTLIIHPVA